MLSFSVINDESLAEVSERLCRDISNEEAEAVREMLVGLSENDDPDLEYAVSYSDGCLLVRIFDMGRYCFMFPYEVSLDADLRRAVLKISEYAMREEIGLSFTDVPFECLGTFSGFRHINVDAEDPDASVYRVTVKSECELLSEIPEIEAGRVKLTPIKDEDLADFARLSKDTAVNKYWGYNYSEDAGAPSDEYFINTASEEFLRGVSMSCAARLCDSFVGEVVFYAFDGMGGAEFALRLLPEWQGKGLSLEIKDAVIAMAEKIGLTQLSAIIMKENVPSLGFASRFMDKSGEDDGRVCFKLNLYN